MKFWQAALLSLMLALCVGGLLRIVSGPVNNHPLKGVA
jgi:hypothetical protein